MFTFAFKAFHIPSSKKEEGKQSLVSIVKENLNSMNLPHDRPSKARSADFYKRVEAKVSDFDVRGATTNHLPL